MKQLKLDAVAHDESYKERIISHSHISITSASSGVNKLLPNFDEKFTAYMFHLRNELLDLNGEHILLVPNFKVRLPDEIKEVLKQYFMLVKCKATLCTHFLKG
ncbi:hypothetical protein [Litorilituus sediminis]|uniref:Uncharacterized protein n=1 Tax=Litorilituus sediminis TaxID=718192 RepID=A0A4P6P684_9GAMM|nr:hypothetical protein [Litorilituus sediminis]QBG34932.1 hypothetical protein EMK97_03880 [Litorilituus sediminis]